MNDPDGRYDYSRPGQDRPYGYLRPASPYEERLTAQATEVVDMSREEIAYYVRPPLPQVQLMPDRYGFDTRAIGIREILNVVSRDLPDRRADFSGSQGGYSGTSRNASEIT